jgi:hypothetical protein
MRSEAVGNDTDCSLVLILTIEERRLNSVAMAKTLP